MDMDWNGWDKDRLHISLEIQKTEGKCPECGKPMRRMRSKNGKIYYGCTGYPSCKFLSWDIPTGDKCPKCGKYLIRKGDKIKCSDKNCNYSVDVLKEQTPAQDGGDV